MDIHRRSTRCVFLHGVPLLTTRAGSVTSGNSFQAAAVLVTLSDPVYQVKLLVFLWNSGVTAIERIGDDSLRILDEQLSDEEVGGILDVWKRTHPSVHVQID
jgi:hypothetical protein